MPGITVWTARVLLVVSLLVLSLGVGASDAVAWPKPTCPTCSREWKGDWLEIVDSGSLDGKYCGQCASTKLRCRRCYGALDVRVETTTSQTDFSGHTINTTRAR